MKSRGFSLLIAALVLNCGLSLYLLATRNSATPAAATKSVAATKSDPDRLVDVEQALRGLRSQLSSLEQSLGSPPPEAGQATGGKDSADTVVSLRDRLATMERSLAKLQGALDGISLEASSAERNELFIGENGHLKADEYFAAKQFAIAGEGYLKFLEAHPDHPDHRSILERARSAFNKAGYGDKAIWAQEELMRIYPERRTQDLMTLARLEKDAGRFESAATHAAEAGALDQTSNRYWNLLYAAWYTELDQGPQASLDYYRNVQQQIVQAGYGEHALGVRAQEKIDELERRLAANP